MLTASVNYVRSHWRGQQSLFRSFWINLVGLRFALFAIQELLTPEDGADWSSWRWQFLAWAVFAHGVVLVWQCIGVIRAAEHYYKDTGSQASMWGAQLAMVPLFFLSATYLLQAWQQSQPLPDVENYLEAMEREREKNYSLRFVPGLSAVELNGSVELGATRKLRGILQSGVPVTLFILESEGGNIYEARGLAKLVRQYKLNTHVSQTCASACTAVFMGGTRRTISASARIGFHQYRFDASYKILNVDPAEEQQKDIELFREQGVDNAFLDKVFQKPSSQMWFPEASELLEAHVIHQIIGSGSR